jgi:hypothetical protein
MDYFDSINNKVDEIYSKHAAELEKEHKGEVVAIDLINKKILKILKPDKISELIKNLKKTETKVAFRKIGEKEAVFHFR